MEILRFNTQQGTPGFLTCSFVCAKYILQYGNFKRDPKARLKIICNNLLPETSTFDLHVVFTLEFYRVHFKLY